MKWGVVGANELDLGNGVLAVAENGFDVYRDAIGEWGTYDEATFVYEEVAGRLRQSRAGRIPGFVQPVGPGGSDRARRDQLRRGQRHPRPPGRPGATRRCMSTRWSPPWGPPGATVGKVIGASTRRSDHHGGGGGGPLTYPNAGPTQRVGDVFTIYRRRRWRDLDPNGHHHVTGTHAVQAVASDPGVLAGEHGRTSRRFGACGMSGWRSSVTTAIAWLGGTRPRHRHHQG